jgi:hypothetical protein
MKVFIWLDPHLPILMKKKTKTSINLLVPKKLEHHMHHIRNLVDNSFDVVHMMFMKL